jgi:hypothetical protein
MERVFGSNYSETLTESATKIYDADDFAYSGGHASHQREKSISINPNGQTKTLKLDKIIIVSNKALSSTPSKSGTGFPGVSQLSGNVQISEKITVGSEYTRDIVNSSYSSMSPDNIYDVNDNLTTLENAALQTVNLGYDYSLEQSLGNAESGSLTLKSLQVDAYGNNSNIPPYEFTYYNSQATPSVYPTLFNASSRTVDDWGLLKDHPEENALKEILYPEGKRLEIIYESDKYYSVDEAYEEQIIANYRGYEHYTGDEWTYIAKDEKGFRTNFNNLYTGGYRVKELRVKNQNKTFTTKYTYLFDDKGHEGGTVLYKPYTDGGTEYVPLYQYLPYITPLYNRVEVIDCDEDGNYKSKRLSQFETCNRIYSIIEREEVESLSDQLVSDYENIIYDGILKMEWKTTSLDINGVTADIIDKKIHNNINKYGRLKSTQYFNKFDELTGAHSYNYAKDFALTAGINKESAYNITHKTNLLSYNKWNLFTYSVREYPQVSYQINSGQGNSSSASYAKKFDLITGLPVVLEGGSTIAELTPAYRIFPEMGPKADNPTHANMLTPVAYDKKYNASKVSDNVYDAEAKIFEKVEDFHYDNAGQAYTGTNNWRVTKVYDWNGSVNADGTYKDFNNTVDNKNFDFTCLENCTTNTDNDWLLSRHNLEYSKYMNPRTYKYTNGIFNTNIYNIYHNKTIAKVFGCSRNSATFSSFEEHEGNLIDGGIRTTGSVNFVSTSGTVLPHSGNQMLELSAGATAFVEFDNTNASLPVKTGLYQFDVWVNKAVGNSPKIRAINGSQLVELLYNDSKSVGNWVLLSITADFSSLQQVATIRFELDNSLGAQTIYIDDFRVKPVDASMETYVYDATTGRLKSTLNPNHFATHYKYDQNGQVNEVWQESLKYGLQKMSESSYGYHRNAQQ